MRSCRYLFGAPPTDDAELEKWAKVWGVSMFNTAETKFGKTGTNTYEVQRRILEARRDWRDSWLWAVALLSAFASVISALAAWAAVLSKGSP
jgi:hypothetical protein